MNLVPHKTGKRARHQAHALPEGPRSPFHGTQDREPRPCWARSRTSRSMIKIRGFQIKRWLR